MFLIFLVIIFFNSHFFIQKSHANQDLAGCVYIRSAGDEDGNSKYNLKGGYLEVHSHYISEDKPLDKRDKTNSYVHIRRDPKDQNVDGKLWGLTPYGRDGIYTIQSLGDEDGGNRYGLAGGYLQVHREPNSNPDERRYHDERDLVSTFVHVRHPEHGHKFGKLWKIKESTSNSRYFTIQAAGDYESLSSTNDHYQLKDGYLQVHDCPDLGDQRDDGSVFVHVRDPKKENSSVGKLWEIIPCGSHLNSDINLLHPWSRSDMQDFQEISNEAASIQSQEDHSYLRSRYKIKDFFPLIGKVLMNVTHLYERHFSVGYLSGVLPEQTNPSLPNDATPLPTALWGGNFENFLKWASMVSETLHSLGEKVPFGENESGLSFPSYTENDGYKRYRFSYKGHTLRLILGPTPQDGSINLISIFSEVYYKKSRLEWIQEKKDSFCDIYGNNPNCIYPLPTPLRKRGFYKKFIKNPILKKEDLEEVELAMKSRALYSERGSGGPGIFVEAKRKPGHNEWEWTDFVIHGIALAIAFNHIETRHWDSWNGNGNPSQFNHSIWWGDVIRFREWVLGRFQDILENDILVDKGSFASDVNPRSYLNYIIFEHGICYLFSIAYNNTTDGYQLVTCYPFCDPATATNCSSTSMPEHSDP